MNNLTGYVQSYPYTFRERAFTEVDSLVLSQLAYLQFEQCGLDIYESILPLGSLAANAESKAAFVNATSKSKMRDLVRAISMSPRFRGIIAARYVNQVDTQINKQFSAVTYILEDGAVYIAFRGTDSTMAAWKENLNLAVLPTTPSQQESVSYLEAIVEIYPAGPIYLGGHSKGGNLAVYASACCRPQTQDHILSVFSHDGPGFQEEFFTREGYQRIRGRIHKTVPESAFIGMLFRHQEPYTIVESKGVGIFQHDALSWVVSNGRFVVKEAATRTSRATLTAFNTWLENLDAPQRQRIVEVLILALEATHATSTSDLASETLRNFLSLIRRFTNADPDTKHFLHEKFKELEVLLERAYRDSSADG